MRGVRTAIALAGLALLAGSAALALSHRTAATTYGGASTGFRVLELAAAASLVGAAAMLLAERATAGLGTLAVAAAAAWLAPLWAGWEGGPSPVRSAGLAAAPLLPALVLAIAARVPPTRRALDLGGAAVLAVAIAAAVALVLVRDPLRDLYCWSDCTVRPLLGGGHDRLTRRLTRDVLMLGQLAGVAAAIAGAVRLARARRGSGPALAAATLAGLALAAYALALRRDPNEIPHRPLFEWLFAARSLALLALGGTLAWVALRPRLVRDRVARLAVDLAGSAAEGGLGARLAKVLGDPGLRLGYPIGPGDRVVAADGRPLVLDGTRRVTPLVDEGGVAALVESDRLSVDALERELGPAAQLALGNERLRAEALARLEDVRASRARIVETADAVRRRIERDLHDGAQQRMLALSYDLRVALTIAEAARDERASAPLRAALARAESAARELRDVAHGIFPAELATSGLAGALESLADLRPLRLELALPSGRRYRPDVEAAVYAVVAEAAEDGAELVVAIREADDTLAVAIEGDVDWAARLVRLEDRVGAAGGSVRLSGCTLEARFSA